MSTKIMFALLAFYVAIMVAAAIEKNWWRVCYFLGAIIISIAVLGMSEK